MWSLRVSQFGGTSIQPPQASYITYLRPEEEWILLEGTDSDWLENAQKLTLLEARTTIESGTTGLRTWTASFVLADFLRQNKSMLNTYDVHMSVKEADIQLLEKLTNARVLELGSGAGFLGITIAQMQLDLAEKNETASYSLYLTDMSEQVLDRCRHNIELECSEFEWP